MKRFQILLSSFDLCRYTPAERDGGGSFGTAPAALGNGASGRGLHSSPFQLNLSRFWHKLRQKHPLVTPDTA